MANRTEPLTRENAGATSTQKRGGGFRIPWAQIIMYLILLIGVVIAILPFFWMVSASLMTYGETATRQWWPSVPQWGNYAEAWREAEFSKYFMNSVIITAVTLTGQLITSTLAGYAFARIKFIKGTA